MSRQSAIRILILVLLLGFTAAVHAGTNTWTSNGPFGGLMDTVAFDPADPNTLYAGTFDGRIFKTVDAGAGWSEVAAFDSVIAAVAVDPSGSGRVYAAARAGIFRSTDAGATWQVASNGFFVLDVRALVIDPLNPNTLYAGTAGGGVYKSTDAAESWFLASMGLLGLDVRALAVDPVNPNVVYAGTADGGVFKSVSAATAWTAVNEGLASTDVRTLVLDPAQPDVLYAGTWGNGVFKSADGALTWSAANVGLEALRVAALVIDAANPNTLYAGTELHGVFRSFDAGGLWSATNAGLAAVDVRGLAIHPANPNTFYAATFGGGGVNRTTDGATTWSPRNAGIDGTAIEVLAVDPLNPNTVYAGTMLDGLFKSTDAGATWAAINNGLDAPIVHALAIDPSNPNVLYAGTWSHGAFRSTTAGVTWLPVGAGLPDTAIRALAIDPANSNTLYAGTRDGVFKSTDAGTTWEAANEGLADLDVEALAVDPTNPNVVYAGTEAGGVFRSPDAAAGWLAVNVGLGDFGIRSLAIDPADSSTVYAATSTGIYRTSDSAATWSLPAGGPVGVRSVTIDPQDSAKLYAGTLTDGVWKSSDAGTTWSGQGLAGLDVPVQALAVDPADPARLFAGTFGAAVSELTQKPSSIGGRVWHDVNGDGLQDDGEGGFEGATVRLFDDGEELLETTATDADGLYSFPDQATGSYVVEITAPEGYFVSPADQGADAIDSDVDPATGRSGVVVLGEDDVLVIDAGLFRPASISGFVWRDADADGLRDPDEEGLAGVEVQLTSPDSELVLSTFTMDFADYGFGGLAPGRYRLRFTAPDGFTFSPQDQGDDDTLDSDADAAGVTRLIVVASGEAAGADAGLVADEDEPEETTVLAVQDGRFTVEVEWSDFQGATGAGTVVSVAPVAGPVALRSEDSAVVEFFGPNNWEVLIKVLDGRALNGRFWVFFAAATDVELRIQVTDTSCGDVRRYTNPAGVAAPAVTDTSAFPGCEDPMPPSCVGDETTLCLGEGGRFQARIGWSDFAGTAGFGRQVFLPVAGSARSEDSGLFYFFTEDNWELLVKVLDGCGLNNRFWVFSAATTDVEYTLKVTDRASGEIRRYENPLGEAADALNDTAAFPTCDVSWP